MAEDWTPTTERKMKRLRRAIEWSRQKLSDYRNLRYRLINQYVGHHYAGEGGTTDRIPMNLLELAVTIYMANLAGNAPAVNVTSHYEVLEMSAEKIELTVNRDIADLRMKEVNRRLVLEALFGMGVLKCSLDLNAEVPINDIYHAVGDPYIANIDPDNWFHDMRATVMGQCDFMGDILEMPLGDAQDSPYFERGVRDELREREYQRVTEHGDLEASSISGTVDSEDSAYIPRTKIIDCYLPREKMLVALPFDEAVNKPLRMDPYEGPDPGPYHTLGFHDVPGNTLPLPPTSLWLDMHELANQVWRKVSRRAIDTKTILGAARQASDDANRVVKARDGDVITVDHPEKMKEMSFGGIDGAGLAFTLSVKEMFSYLSGNLDVIGGLGTVADTLGQEKLVASANSQRLNAMSDRTIDTVLEVIKALAHYRYSDDLVNMDIVRTIPGTDIRVPTSYTPRDRKGRFIDYAFSIEPYSMRLRTPKEKQMEIWDFLNRLTPFMPMIQMSGKVLDWDGIFETQADLSGIPEIKRFIVDAGMPADSSQLHEMSRQAPVTERINTRVNAGGSRPQGGAGDLIQNALAAGGNGTGR